MDEVVDEELWVGHEVVDGVAGFWSLPALVQRATECFHHSHLPRRRKTREGPQERTKKDKVRDKNWRKEAGEDPETDLYPPEDRK